MLKKIVLQFVIFSLLAFICIQAQAQSRRSSIYTDSATPSYVSTTASGKAGRMAISGGLGFFGDNGGFVTANNNAVSMVGLSGLFGLGADFDYFAHNDVSVGGLFRYYNTSETIASTEYSATVMTIGGTVKAYVFDTDHWEGNFTTGLGFINATAKQGATTAESGMTFGFYFGTSIFYKHSHDLAFGVENLRVLGLGDKLNGWVVSDLMFKARFMY